MLVMIYSRASLLTNSLTAKLILLQNDGQNDSLHMARIEQEKANEGVRILVEKHKVCISTLQL
jgi:hypothetical protein